MVNLILSEEEALVLLEWLFRVQPGENENLIEHQAEQRVLWDLEALLEKQVSQTFSEDYQELLSKARLAILDSQE